MDVSGRGLPESGPRGTMIDSPRTGSLSENPFPGPMELPTRTDPIGLDWTCRSERGPNRTDPNRTGRARLGGPLELKR